MNINTHTRSNVTNKHHTATTQREGQQAKQEIRPRAYFISLLGFSSMEEQGQREIQLQLLLLPAPAARGALRAVMPTAPATAADHPQLDLDLSMSIGPRRLQAAPPRPRSSPLANENRRAPAAAAGARQQQHSAAAVKQQAAEQARMACAERAYAERVRELARRELELAEREFARARAIWERAREEVERVERMKQIAARRLVGSASSAAALEITCHACMQRFHP